MAEVKKREKIPQEIQDEIKRATRDDKPVKITIGDKEYDLPKLKFGEYKKVLKKLDTQPSDDEMDESKALNFTRDFYYELMKGEHPNLKKSDLDDMPIYQYGAEFLIKLKLALFKIPFAS